MKSALNRMKDKSINLDAAVEYSVKKITDIVSSIGPRAPGSQQELKAQQSMAEDVKKWADDVKTEGFTVHRQAFMGFIPFTVALAIVATFLFWFDKTLAGAIVILIAAIPLVLEFLMYKLFLDPIFPGHPSHNTFAVRKAAGETKRRIILVGHTDSQFEWTLNYKLGGTGMKLFLIPAVVGLIACGIANLVKFITLNLAGVESAGADMFFKIVGIALFVFFPCYIGFLFFQNPFRSVPGANDNLTGCLTAMSVMKTLAENDVRFENTDMCVLLTGSEEAGLRGAKAFVKAHKKELDDMETVVVAIDTMRDLEYLAVYDRDLSGTLKHDLQVKTLVKKAAANCGLDLPYASIYLGACDAAAFTQGGIKATGFAAMDPTPPRYYHTRLDTCELLIPEAIKTGIEVMLETVCLYDEEGLDASLTK
ncbi:MAG: Zn-dependent exopeptidase M28 [Clostridiales bacterium]|nr:Zn-dependent exopeptidase M28 [Clostridiales bacterium]